MKKILRIIMTIIQYILILIGILVVVGFVIPSILGYNPRVVKSGSMEPEIKTGSIAYNNKNAKIEDVKVGDVIVFELGDTYVTHRVVSINDDNTFTTKGDANKNEDLEPVKFENYRGKTALSIPYAGYILETVQTKTGIFLLVLTAGLNVIYFIFTSDDKKETKE